jgi:hypothetical protein
VHTLTIRPHSPGKRGRRPSCRQPSCRDAGRQASASTA